MFHHLINQDRLAEVARLGLKSGGHRNISDGMCAMEAASYIAGEPWSAYPKCVSPVIAAFLRSWNDNLPNDERNALIPPDLIAMTIGTRGSAKLEERRFLMVADWLVRTHTVAWLRLANLDKQAGALAGLPEITAMAQIRRSAPQSRQRAPGRFRRRDAAWDAALAAAADAAGDAVKAATRLALQASAGDLIRRMCVLTDKVA